MVAVFCFFLIFSLFEFFFYLKLNLICNTGAGCTLLHLHETKVERRLVSIENAMKKGYDIEDKEFKKLVGTGNSNVAACVATVGVSLLVGYGFDWRGGRWYANRNSKESK